VGHTATCSFTVTVNDAEAPAIITCASDVTKPTDPGVCTAVVNYMTAADFHCQTVIMAI